ncbi:VWA domain-containing protein [Nannocystis sp.]|uniref:vWA domain-containing protein n=1 Tax=Nannocystis sp. TaxID=1962667 RepID=UPI0025F5E348|nr:VWA domain-containing protein [Nannocystis sp.]MBK7830173.1 VWA domain-containing protein [Nannocystis sp.]
MIFAPAPAPAPGPNDLAAAVASVPAPDTVRTLFDTLVLGRGDLLWLLVLVPLVAAGYVWATRQRRAGFARLGNPTLVQRLVTSVHRGNRLLIAVVTTIAALFLVGALMRPQYGGTTRIVPVGGLDVVLVVDYSKSMLAKDVYPSRSERLAAELRRFLDEAEHRGDQVGLVVFAGAARGLPVSRDTRVLKLYLDKADPRTENPGGTAIGKALKLALQYLVDARQAGQNAVKERSIDGPPPPEADQVIILLTDGEDTSSRPNEMAAEAAKLGIRIYTVGIGSKSGEPIQKFDAKGQPDGYQTDEKGNYLMTRVDEAGLKKLSETTGGEYVLVEPERFGLDAVSEWVRDLTRGQRADTVTLDREEGYPFLVAPALLLLALSLALGERRRPS